MLAFFGRYILKMDRFTVKRFRHCLSTSYEFARCLIPLWWRPKSPSLTLVYWWQNLEGLLLSLSLCHVLKKANPWILNKVFGHLDQILFICPTMGKVPFFSQIRNCHAWEWRSITSSCFVHAFMCLQMEPDFLPANQWWTVNSYPIGKKLKTFFS